MHESDMENMSLDELYKLKKDVEDEIHSRLSLKDKFEYAIKTYGYNGYGDIMEECIEYHGERFYDRTYDELVDEFECWDEEDGTTGSYFGNYICDKYNLNTREKVDEFIIKIMQECVDCKSVGSKEVY